MMARSGSVEGKSGSVTRPAPSCFRVVREEEWLVRREPCDEWLTGDDPVPVVMALEDVEPAYAGTAAAAAFASAWPHTLQ
jgi:hypothetical protein